ncbi:MAG TPA: hypothetical protein VMV69_09795 [Pirellulales bacterium]|nr:hypothetical protein [Pirellulales bacterium]
MPFQRDEKYAAEVGSVFGEYLTTFVSEPRGQVRADLFRKERRVEAHVSFPTGIVASGVTEPYVRALREYARKEGVADHFQLIMS